LERHPDRGKWRSLRDAIRDPSLTATLVLEIAIIFFALPLAAKGLPWAETALRVCNWTTLAIVVLLSERWIPIILLAVALAVASLEFESTASWLAVDAVVLSHTGSAIGFSALTWVVAQSTWASGPINYRRVQGAIVVYLNMAMIFASVYRIIWDLNPAAFNAASAGGQPQAVTFATVMYFSLTTLTTTGYGDITPADPFARGLANLEAVFGQLYLAVTIARLVALNVAGRRR
jgi:voltage-gated potassium channel Kch